jgi:hypothetical protein
MNTRFEELISAYFDGEATAEQRQQAEQLLAENGEARELLDELRALHSDLQLLPRHRLETDFADRVLQRVRQTADARPASESGQLSPSQSDGRRPVDSVQAPAASPAQPPSPAREASDSGMRRALLWSSLAVAAAVLIMIFSGSPPDATVAMKEETAEVPAARKAPEPGDRAREHDEAMVADDLEIGAAVANKQEGLDREDLDLDLDMDKAEEEAEQRKLDRGAAEAGQIAMRAGPQDKPTDSLASAADFDAKRATSRPLTKAGEETLPEGKSSPSAGPGHRFADRGRNGAPATTEAAGQAVPEAMVKELAGSLSDNDGIAYFRSTQQTSPAVVDAYVRRQLEAKKLRANHARQGGVELQRRVRRTLSDGRERQTVGKTSNYFDIVYEIEGTGEQIYASLAQLKTQPDAIQFVSTDARLGEMLASLPSLAEKASVDQLAQADPTSTGSFKKGKVKSAPADDNVHEAFADKEAKQDVSDAPAEPAADSALPAPQKAARGYPQPQRAGRAAQAPDSAKNVKPAAEASGELAAGGVGGGPGRVAAEAQKKSQRRQAGKDAELARSVDGQREVDRFSGAAETSPPAALDSDTESRRKAAGSPGGEKPGASDKGGAARDEKPGQLAENEKHSSKTRYKILLVFRVDNAAWLGTGDNPAAARQAIGDELPDAPAAIEATD